MPCLFCIAALTLITGAITATVIDHLEQRLAGIAHAGLQRVSDSDSATLFHLSVPAPAAPGTGTSAPVPVAVTVYKQQRQVRIQVLSHDIEHPAVHALYEHIAAALGAQITTPGDGQPHPATPAATPQAATSPVGHLPGPPHPAPAAHRHTR